MAAASDGAEPSRYWVYLGGYTGGAAGGKGILVAPFDAGTGQLGKPELAAEVPSPSFLAIHPDGKSLYAVGESGGKGGGPVYSFAIDPATGKLTERNRLTSGGDGPCHIALDAKGEFAVVANYGGGSAAVFKVAPDGSLAARTAFVQHGPGSMVDKGRQEGPHAHSGAFDKSGTHVLVADLGMDKVLVYQLDRAAGTLTPRPPIVLPPGSGPRHFQLTAAEDYMVVCGEMASTANLVKLDLAAGTSEVVQTLSTLPQPTPGNSTAEVRLHPSGKYAYVSNRGHNSVAAFSLEGGKLKALGYATDKIKVPRNFALDPAGKWMLVANQDANTVVVFAIGSDGLPKPTGGSIDAPMPVCVKFLERK